MTADDKRRADEIGVAAGEDRLVVHLIMEYWRDLARAERAPRELLYLHMGILCGILERLLPDVAQ